MDATQLLLSIMIFLLGVTLTVIGIQFYFILKEFKKSIEKVNLILDDAQIVAKNLSNGSQQLQNLVSLVRESTQGLTKKISGPLSTGLAVFGLVRGVMAKLKSHELKSHEEVTE